MFLSLSLALVACSGSITTIRPDQAEAMCHLPSRGGYLVANSRTGLGIRVGAENHPVIWPVGFSARRIVMGPLVLVDRSGNEIAREGDLIEMSGGYDKDGTFYVCDKATFRVKSAGR